jgi:uncharacterized protein (TIGR00269 family)
MKMKSPKSWKSSDAKFAEHLERKVSQAISKYRLASKKDRIAVGVSGGKDSTAVLYILKKLGYNVEAITIDVLMGKYTAQNLDNIRKFCKQQGIKLHVVSFRQKIGCSVCYALASLKSKGHKLKSCTVCGVIRRYLLNKEARRIGAAAVVTGHNLDDEAQTILMNLLKNRMTLNLRISPKPGVVKDSRFVPRIKPLFFIPEKDIERYSKLRNFPVVYIRCPCGIESARAEVRKFLDEYEKISPGIKQKIVSNFLKLLPKLKKKFAGSKDAKQAKMQHCANCGEPSTQKICRVCQMLENLKSS